MLTAFITCFNMFLDVLFNIDLQDLCKCLYSDIAMTGHDSKALMYDFPPKVWKRFRDDVFVVWTHDTAKLASFLDYLNNIDETGKIKFIMQIVDEINGLEFLDLTIRCLNGKISVDDI